MAQHTFGRDSWVEKLRVFLADHNYSRHAIKSYSLVARRFLNRLEDQQVSINAIQPAHVDAYLRFELNRYRRKHGRDPNNVLDWRWHLLSPIHRLLALAQGEWPPLSASEARVRWFEEALKADGHSRSTVGTYVRISRGFLNHLGRAGVDLMDVEPRHISSFIDYELRRYQQRHRRLPARLVDWRCGLTSPIHLLLRKVRGRIWPPLESPHPYVTKLEEQLKKERFSARALTCYLHRCRHFLSYLETRGIAIEQVHPSEVRLYCRRQLAIYSKKHRRQPLNRQRWTVGTTSPVNRLLRLVLGAWPPGSEPDPAIEEYREHLGSQRFSATVIPNQLSKVRCFLRYLKEHKVLLASVQSEHVSGYLKVRLALYRRRNGQLPRNLKGWRHGQTGPIHRLLHLLQGQWPPAQPIVGELELLRRNLLSAYASWMVDLRGLSQPTVRKNHDAARIFLEWLGDEARSKALQALTIPAIDRFLAWRNPKLRRATRHGVVVCLRDFLRYLHDKGHLKRDLVPSVSGVKLYRFEDVPKAFTSDQVHAVLEHIYKDESPAGYRDYAIALLLADYGLRAGEIVRLRLDDIDWRREEIRVIQSKSYLPLLLPLSSTVGNAILRYLKKGRPQSKAREIFLRLCAPQGAFRHSSSLGTMIARRLKQAGIGVEGRHGTHAFRHAHAVSLLRAQVQLKTIGDLLGHRSPASTSIYLKLATEDLRCVALEIPLEVRNENMA